MANLALVDLLTRSPSGRGDARPDRAGLVAGAEAVDRPDPGHHQAHRLEENLAAAALELTPDD